MMEVVRGYLLRLTAGAFLSAGLLALIPKGTSKKAAAVLCGLVMLLLALTPLAQLDYDALSEAISRLELEKEEARTGIEIRNQEHIRPRTGIYIGQSRLAGADRHSRA